MTFDGKAFGAEIVGAVKSHVAEVIAPIMSRLDAMEQRLADVPAPTVGVEDIQAVKSDIEAVRSAMADEEAIASRVAKMVGGELAELRKAVDAIPEAPELPDIPAMVQETVEEIRIDLSEQMDTLREGIEERIAALPAPKDGRDGVDGKDGVGVSGLDIDMIDDGATMVLNFYVGEGKHSFEVPLPAGPEGKEGPAGKDGVDGKAGRDGLDVKDLFRAEGGHLLAVMSDGTTKDLGEYVGKAGTPGRDGIDGVGFDDMLCETREDGVYLVWEKGDLVKEARLPIPIDRGVWREDGVYKAGHCVTWAGSVWIAQKDAPEGKPDAGDWRLAVKRGRDGKSPGKV